MGIFPSELREAIRQKVGGLGGFATQSSRMSQHYRAGGGSDATLDLNAYLVTRLPATYAAISASLAALPPNFSPKSVLDAGCGPGTAGWASVDAYPDISNITFLDNNMKFLGLAKELGRTSSHPALRNAASLCGDITEPPVHVKADLVIAAYCFAEQAMATVSKAAVALWAASNGTLIIVEPGTTAGFARIIAARSVLVSAGANILAPCTHANTCPLSAPDWCHFKIRLARSREHLHAKNAQVPFEDESYSYLIASRNPVQAAKARILATPVASKPEISFKLCTPEGVSKQSIARRDRAEYKRVRKLGWGDLF